MTIQDNIILVIREIDGTQIIMIPEEIPIKDKVIQKIQLTPSPIINRPITRKRISMASIIYNK